MYSFRVFSRVAEFLPAATSTGVKHFAMSSSVSLPSSRSEPCAQKSVDIEENYENAIRTLNSLQSNAQTLALARLKREETRSKNLPHTIGALETMGLTLDLLDNLDIVHVAGTKGKGMTCAFTEGILRKAGLKTGFFSSPHLIAVRERIRINGKPLSENEFAKHFFTVFNQLKRLQEPNSPYDMPAYFRFLTCMAFHVFVEEEVDAVILEVGIGGKYDITNVIRKPVVTGISSLGLEHQNLLGNTLEEIAIQKAGIMKKGVPSYTVGTHPPHILDILRSHSASVECSLHSVQPLDLTNTSIKLGVDDGFVARVNAGLAVSLANEFLLQKHPHLFPSLPSDIKCAAELRYSKPENFLPFHVEGLQSTKWDGRFQVFQVSDQVTFYLDGAHTVDSIMVARKWFEARSANSEYRILIFNLTRERSALSLLQPLAESDTFNLAVFCPFIGFESQICPDSWSILEGNDPMDLCQKHVETWESLQNISKGAICSSAEAAIKYVTELISQEPSNGHKKTASVLVTGSLHLVGTFLSVLDPNRND